MLPDYLEDLVLEWHPVGSRITCNPPPTDTDQDILCLVHPKQQMFYDELTANKWELEGEYGNIVDFDSYRKEDTNLIVTEDEEWFRKFMQAHEFCKEQNLLTKEARIKAFDRLMGKKPRKSLKELLMNKIAPTKNVTTDWLYQKMAMETAQALSQSVVYEDLFNQPNLFAE